MDCLANDLRELGQPVVAGFQISCHRAEGFQGNKGKDGPSTGWAVPSFMRGPRPSGRSSERVTEHAEPTAEDLGPDPGAFLGKCRSAINGDRPAPARGGRAELAWRPGGVELSTYKRRNGRALEGEGPLADRAGHRRAIVARRACGPGCHWPSSGRACALDGGVEGRLGAVAGDKRLGSGPDEVPRRVWLTIHLSARRACRGSRGDARSGPSFGPPAHARPEQDGPTFAARLAIHIKTPSPSPAVAVVVASPRRCARAS